MSVNGGTAARGDAFTIVRSAIRAIYLPAALVGLVSCARDVEQLPKRPAGTQERGDASVDASPPGPPPAVIGPADDKSGEILGVAWSVAEIDGATVLSIGERQLVLERADGPCFVTDALHGCWESPAEIAEQLIRFSPDYSPLAHPQ